jgi:AcrR family transcriptional regulator
MSVAARVHRYPRRAAAATRTRAAILEAARMLVRDAAGRSPSVGQIASAAGVSRLSVYHHFGSRAGVLGALADQAQPLPAAAGADARAVVATAVAQWAGDPALYRRLPDAAVSTRELATSLAAEDRLRPGCSLKEAEDVLAVLTSFAAFDRLHQDGRRSTAAVIEILMRMAGSILNPST